MILDRIPVVRGWLARWRNHAAKKGLLSAYARMMQSFRGTSITAIRFDQYGCVYSLEDGRSFLFDPDKSAGWLYSVPFSGTFEEKETGFVRRTVQKDWVCLDIGGCFGWYTVLFSKLVGEAGKVYAFEPVPDNRTCLERNLAINACTNVRLIPCALGERNDHTQIFLPLDGVSGSLRAHAKLAKCKIIDVEVSTVDQVASMEGLQRLDFVKADIEGAEFLMLKGALETFSKFRPMLMLEIQAHSTRLFGYEPIELFTLLKNLGYRPHYVGKDYELIRCDEMLAAGAKLPDYNFVFKYEESPT